MILRSGYPFWLIKNGLPHAFPKLAEDIETEVLIIGAGISGALVRYHLLKAGINCAIVDARTIGLGSTCASTSLLQYEIDVPLCKLIDLVGKHDAERSYHLCNEAIEKIGNISKELHYGDFQSKDSLYYAAYKKDVDLLQREFEARQHTGFDVEFLDEKAVKKRFGFSAPAAILSHHGAQIDAYSFTHRLLQYKKEWKHQVYDRTKIIDIQHDPKGVIAKTEQGHAIRARKVVYATGYEVTEMIDKKVVELKSTYAVISEQYAKKQFWKDNTLLWSTADPYLYMRTTSDGRMLIGGRDEDFYNPKKRDALIAKKSKQLVADFKKLFPEKEFNAEFSWTGTFGETKDGLPYIGEYSRIKDSYFALGFGGNGITFSLIAAEIITDLIQGKKNKDADIFSFDR
jgi:glycine/D-amino acid oxidase-like deaminating enzyme